MNEMGNKKYFLILVVVTILIISGCNTGKYACYGGSQVSNPNLCPMSSSDIQFNVFWEDSASCSNLREEKATMSISFSVNNKKDSEACKLYVDNQETGGPIYENIPKSNNYFLGIFNAYEDHKAKVCCGDICKDVGISKLCNKEPPKITSEVEESYEGTLNEICKIEPDTCGCPFTSNYKNNNVAVICETCRNEENFLKKTLEYQTEVYNCLLNYFSYDLDIKAKPIKYEITFIDEYSQSEFINSFNSAGYCSVKGYLRNGEILNIGADVHETAHIFTNSLFNQAPTWFKEGISIEADSRIKCSPPKSEPFHGMRETSINNLYLPLKKGDRSHFQNDPHYIGEMFNLALELDYNCNVDCFFRIVKDLKDTCYESENCEIDNKKIKNSAEKITEKDLTQLFNLLEINY